MYQLLLITVVYTCQLGYQESHTFSVRHLEAQKMLYHVVVCITKTDFGSLLSNSDTTVMHVHLKQILAPF